MEINGYAGDVPANDWLILGPFDMTGVSSPVVEFNSLAYHTAGVAGEMAIKISTDYPGYGSPSTSTWQSLSFTQPVTELTKTASGQVPLTGASGQASVYLAFHYTAGGTTAGATALWQIDDVEVYNMTLPSLSVIAPGSMTEGSAVQFASVSIPSALAEDLTITLTSADATDLLIDGDGLGFAAISTAVIPAGLTSVEFLVQPVADNVIDGNQSVQIIAEATGYDFGQAMVQVVDVNFATPSVVINKVINNDSTDIVELLVVGDGTVGSTADLQGMILKDYSGSAATDGGGSFTFATSATWSAVPAGTLIVLTNQTTGTEDLDAADFVLRANLKNAALFTAAGSFDIGAPELVQIKAAGSAVAGAAGVIHSVAFGTSTAAQVVAAPRPKLVSAITGNFQVATNATGTLVDFDGAGLTPLAFIPATGIPNNAGNALFIAGLRGLEAVSVSIAGTSAVVNENAGEQTNAITVDLTTPAASDLTVNLSASPSLAISLPASVFISTGQSSATVSFTPVDDGTPSGNRDVTITATAAGYQDGTNTVTLVDAQFSPPSVVINEVLNGGTGGADSAELLVINNNLNMVGMIFKDFSGNMGGDGGGKYTFKDVPLWQSVPAGTLIVLTTDAAATEDTDGSDGVVTVKLTNTTYFTSTGSFDISATDMVMIKASGSGTTGTAGAIHTFGVGAAGSYFTLAGGAKLLGTGAAVSADNATSTLADYNGTGATAQTSTSGAANNSANQAYINALRASAPPVIAGTLTLSGTVGTAITPYQITASGSPTSYSSGTLPAGLTLDTGTGIISGTPTAAQAATDVQISATNSGGPGTANLAITIAKGTPVIQTAPTASDLIEGDALSASTLTGGSASVAGTFDWTSPSTVPPVGTAGYAVTFTPTDTANYETAPLTVNVTVVSGDYLFTTWSGNATMTSELLSKFAIGGALSPTASGEAPVIATEGGALTLTAIIRTNNSSLTVTGEAVADLAGTWSDTGVTSTVVGVSQTGVPDGCERRKFSVTMAGTKQFLRLKATLLP
ncbi:MAG: beta strand repeat-containing protein [Terrimicrobiaceae bacterium]